jgi:hypothetical protein
MTNLVCGVQDRLIVDALDTQRDLETEPRAIRGLSQSDICVHHSLRTDFFLTLFRRNGLDRTQEACCFLLKNLKFESDIGDGGVVDSDVPE